MLGLLRISPDLPPAKILAASSNPGILRIFFGQHALIHPLYRLTAALDFQTFKIQLYYYLRRFVAEDKYSMLLMF